MCPQPQNNLMTVTFSTHFIEFMGFSEAIGEGAITACFVSVTVYEARGIVVPEGFSEALSAQIAGANCRVAIAQSVNQGCQALTDGDDFVEAEPEWRKQVKSDGPFVLIGVGPTEFVECSAGSLRRNADGGLSTFNCFPQMHEALRSLEERVIPSLLSAMTCALNEPDLYVALRRLGRASSGKCPDGTQVQDFRIAIEGGEAHGSRFLDSPTLLARLDDIARMTPALNTKAAKFFALGVGESDHLKRFLYFFLALEIETNAVFARIDHQSQTVQLMSGRASPSAATLDLLSRQVKSLKALLDKFVWCVACAWTDLSESDVTLFKELKLARDEIAHGRTSEPPAGFSRSAEVLARKILWR